MSSPSACGGWWRLRRKTGDRPLFRATKKWSVPGVGLLRLDAGLADRLGPLVGLGLLERGERLRRRRDELRPLGLEALLDLGRTHDLLHLGVEAVHDLGRRAGRREESDPVAHHEARD